MWDVYVLKSLKDSKHYVGSTSGLNKRIKRHGSGGNVSTRHRRPFKLVYKETFKTRSEAVARELEIKPYKGGIQFKKLIEK